MKLFDLPKYLELYKYCKNSYAGAEKKSDENSGQQLAVDPVGVDGLTEEQQGGGGLLEGAEESCVTFLLMLVYFYY